MLKIERTDKKSLFEIDPQNRYELGNIHNLNFLTVNYLQRKAMINDLKMFEDVTEAIKEIKSFILEKSDFASDLFPSIQSKQNETPEFLIDLNKSEFMSKICNEDKFKTVTENNIKTQDPSKYFYFKVLMFSISVGGYYAPYILQNFHKNFNNIDELNNWLLANEDDWVHYKSYDIISKYNNISTTEYDFFQNKNSIECKKILLNRKKKEDKKYKYLRDFGLKKKCFELIEKFSQKYGYYDAYSLTAYHNIEYYLDCFSKIIVTNENNKNQYPISSLIYPKCFNLSEYLIFKKNKAIYSDNKFYQNELNIFTGRGKTFKDECKRLIGLLIWDVYKAEKKLSITNAIIKVEKWLQQKYATSVSLENDNIFKDSYEVANKKKEERRKNKYRNLGIKMESQSMEKLYEIAHESIKKGEYLQRNNKKGYYYRPQLFKSDVFIESLQDEFWNKTMHCKHGNYKFL